MPKVGMMLQHPAQDWLLEEFQRVEAEGYCFPCKSLFGCLNFSFPAVQFLGLSENTDLHFATDLLVQQCQHPPILADTSDTEARRRQVSFPLRKRCGNVLAAEVALTSRRKVRSCKGAEPKWKQILSYRCLEKVLQQSLYEHSFVPGPLASPCLLFWGWWLKSGCPAIRWFPSHYSVPGKAAAANEGLMFLICFTMQKSFCWDSSSEDSICLFLQEIIWVSELMPRDWVLYLLLRRKLPFFLSSSSKAKSSLVFLLSHTERWGKGCILQFNRDTTLH